MNELALRVTLVGCLLMSISGLWIGCSRSEFPVSSAPPKPAIDITDTRVKAEQGNPDAQKLLGDLYASGKEVPQNFKEAAAWFKQAAEQGNPAAQNSLGELYEAGQGLPHSDLEAAAWYRKAAEQGNAAAQYNLAVLHAFGRGIKLNEAEAVTWYRKAAERGHALAQFNIGQRYQLGKGVTADSPEAYKWLALAARSVPDSAKLLDDLKSTMTRQQITEGRRRVASFQPVTLTSR